MRALYLSGFYPAHDAPSSGPKIVAREIDALRAAGWEVTVVSFENELDRRHLHQGFPPPQEEGSRRYKLTRPTRLLAAVLFPTLPLAASARPLVARAHVWRLLRRQSFDRIVVEFSQAADVLPRGYWPRATLVAHDVLTQLYSRRREQANGWRKWVSTLELRRVIRWETEAFRRFGTVTVLNEKDRALVQAATGRCDIQIRYPDVPRYIEPAERTPQCVDPSMLLFWGHMGRAENVDAVEYFVATILPLIRDKRPQTRLVVAGIDPPASIRRLAGGSVEVTGFIENPAPLFRAAAVGVVPLRLGAGIKIKTVEMLACGMPCVATSIGAEGVRPSELLVIEDDPAAFADSVVQLLDRAVADRGSERAQQTSPP